jgi:hypothetical protein
LAANEFWRAFPTPWSWRVAEPVVLDSFTLFGPVPPRAVAQPGTKLLTDLMTRHGVAGAISLSTRGLYHSAPAGNRETAALCRETGATLQPGAVLDPRLPLAGQAVTGARMLCLLPATQRWPLPFAPLTELLRALAASGSNVPVFWEATRLGDATRIAEAVFAAGLKGPQLLGSMTAESLIEALAVARAAAQFSLVTNGLRGVGEIAMTVTALGSSRVLFGSEAPVRSLGSALALVRRAGLDEADLEAVLGGNAKRLIAAGGAAQ